MKKILTFASTFFLFALYSVISYAKCLTIQGYITEGVGENFLLMPATRMIAQICTTVANSSWISFAQPLQAVVAVGASVYIATYTLKNIGSFSKQDVGAYLSNDKTGIIPLMTKIGVILVLLSDVGNQFLYGNLIIPVVNTSMKAGLAFGSASPEVSNLMETDARDVAGLFSSVLDLLKSFNQSTYVIVALGKVLLCQATSGGFFSWYWTLIPFGLLLYIMGWFICIGLAFSLLDIVFRLGVGCMILPHAVACGTSKLTSSYTRKTWGLFVNVSFCFIVLGMTIGIVLNMITAAMDGGNSGHINKIINNNLLSEGELSSLEDRLDFTKFILVTLCCMIGLNLFGEVEDLASKFSGTDAAGGGAKKMGMAMSKQALDAGKTAAKQPLKLADHMASETGKDIKNSKAVRTARVGINNFKKNTKEGIKNGAKKAFGAVKGLFK